jgi:hypothetical protein
LPGVERPAPGLQLRRQQDDGREDRVEHHRPRAHATTVGPFQVGVVLLANDDVVLRTGDA